MTMAVTEVPLLLANITFQMLTTTSSDDNQSAIDSMINGSFGRRPKDRTGAHLYRGLEKYFLVWYLPLVLIVGSVGAVFCLIFLFQSKLFQRNILIWMVSICIADLMILMTDALRMHLKVSWGYDIRDENTFLCKTHTFFSNFFFYWSGYMQACMSLQRLYFVLQPLKARVHLRFHRILFVWLMATGICVLSHIVYLVIWEVRGKKGDCEPTSTWYYFVTTVTDLIIWGIIPLVAMTLSTIKISSKIFAFSVDNECSSKQMISQQRRRASSLDSDNHAVNVPGGAKRHRNVGQRHGGADNASHVTKLLVSLNMFYMVTTYPLLIYLMHLNFGLKNKVGVTIPQQVHKFYYYFFRSICYMNSSCNWLFYCAAGNVFRKRAITLLRRIFCSRCDGRSRTGFSEATELDTRVVSTAENNQYNTRLLRH